MARLLGIDTGGTYTDAVILDDETDQLVASAKALTTRPDLSIGVQGAIDAVLAQGGIDPAGIAMVSLSTTLATNALVEGQGERAGLVLIGFSPDELDRAGLREALGDDPVAFVEGGHSHSGAEAAPFTEETLSAELEPFSNVSAVAVASRFATRNPDHEARARAVIRDRLDVPVTCSHELSQALGGPKRALTALLNARLIGLIDRLIAATEDIVKARGISARLMVVRGDGALVSSDLARERPIETILSGPAASIAGAQWLTGLDDALVSDIGGTTTDICLLKDGRPKIDPEGAKVGKYRTMVEAVAMRTFGLGGDSEVHITEGLDAGLVLGPRRVLPVSRLAVGYPDLVGAVLDRALASPIVQEDAMRFVFAQWQSLPTGLDSREAAVASRLSGAPISWSEAIQNRAEIPAIYRLVQRGLVGLAGITPSDAQAVLGGAPGLDAVAADAAMTLFARQRTGSGDVFAASAKAAAEAIVDQLTKQTVEAVLETALAEEGWPEPAVLARHSLMAAGLDQHSNVMRFTAGLAQPIIGLGASAATYYGAVGERLGCEAVLPNDGGVANAIGAVVGQVSHHAEGSVTSAGEGAFRAHLPEGPKQFNTKDDALEAVRVALTGIVTDRAAESGVEEPRIEEDLSIQEAQVEAQVIFVEATMRITARGRPRIAD